MAGGAQQTSRRTHETANRAAGILSSVVVSRLDAAAKATTLVTVSMTGNSRFAVSVHILAYLAFRKGHAVPSAEIASSVDTNPVVIRRLLSTLAKVRLVYAHKGASGGFALACAPDDISLLDIYRAVEPQPNHGLSSFAPNPRCPVGAKIGAILVGVFAQAQASMEAELDKVSIADVEQQLHAVCPHKRLAST
jgi:Rrf2 family protein